MNKLILFRFAIAVFSYLFYSNSYLANYDVRNGFLFLAAEQNLHKMRRAFLYTTNNQMNKAKYQLFERTFYDLRNKLNGDGYDYIKGLGLLRLLIVDGAISLVNQCKKELRLKIIYKTRKETLRENKPEIMWSVIAPIEFTNEEVDELSLDRFLAKPVFIYKEETYTVRDFIYYGSSILGGVHSGTPKNERERIFIWAQNAYPFQNTYHSIIQVVIKALQPLLDEIIRLNLTGGF